MEIQINNTTYQLRNTIRGQFVYERIAGESFKPGKIIDEYVLFYSILIACNENFTTSFEEFIEACDADKTLFPAFQKWFVGEIKKLALLMPEKPSTDAPETKKNS